MKELLLASLFILSLGAQASADKNLSTLDKVVVSNGGKFSMEATFFFTAPCKISQKVFDSRISVFFPSVRMGDFDKAQAIQEFAALGMVKNFSIDYIDKPNGILLDVQFASDNVLVKSIHMGDKRQFRLIVFSKDELDRIKNDTNGPLYIAYNGDVSDLGVSLKKKNSKFRVMIDPGHGGALTGACGYYNLVEKDVTLSIAKKVKALLEKSGCEAELTRNRDEDIPVSDRCRLAEKFNADLFISVHANSVANAEKSNGIETYHLNSEPFIGTGGTASYNFFFIKTEHDRKLAKIADRMFKEKEDVSFEFAHSLQNNLVNLLKDKKVDVIDRGIKKACFLVLVGRLNQLKMPSALVEVGFISNKAEAKRLSDDNYRALIATGIAKGAVSFLNKKIRNSNV